MVVWRLTDDKPGHGNQTLGLVAALQRRCPVQCHNIPAGHRASSITDLLFRRYPPGDGLPRPDLLLGAGHATHPPLLAARRAHGGRAVVLMRPSLPLRLFDLCLIPEHDDPPQRQNVLATRGALNGLTAEGPHHPDHSLVLIGGPSRHHDWDGPAVIEQLTRLCRSRQKIRFTLGGSRRTPDSFIEALQAAGIGNCRIVPVEETGPGWVAERLAESAVAWVTEDSVSMVYEALTAGCRVGLLYLRSRGAGRVSRGVDRLIDDGWVTRFESWARGDPLSPSPAGFNEADRCAAWILEQGWV